jgi:hypothetical protein
MIRQIPRGPSHLADAATPSRRGLNPPTVTLLSYKVALVVLEAANRQPVFVSYANHRHMRNLPYQPCKSRTLSSAASDGSGTLVYWPGGNGPIKKQPIGHPASLQPVKKLSVPPRKGTRPAFPGLNVLIL